MAQTKRKRRSTKHRGNAAGIVEARGRTSRPDDVPGVRGKPGNKYDRPPSWKGAAQRAAIAALVFCGLLLVLFKQDPLPALGMTVAVFALYIPLGYYTDAVIFNRRRRKREKAQ
jgi:hypothetical protein